MSMFISEFCRRKTPHLSRFLSLHHLSTTSTTSSSNLYTKYNFQPPFSLHPEYQAQIPRKTPSQAQARPDPTTQKPSKPRYRPTSSLDRASQRPARSDLPFDFWFSYTESNPTVRPIGLREPKYSPFGPDRLNRAWTGVCAPLIDPKEGSIASEKKLEEKRNKLRQTIQGEPLNSAERKALADRCQRHRTKRQVNMGRDGLTHNMLNDIHNNWKHAEAVRIKCMGVPTVDMKNVCSQLEDKTFGKIIHRHGGLLVLYRGRNYSPKNRPLIPLMLWKPREPVYPRLIKTTINGLSIDETKQMRKKGLAVPALAKLAKNGYYGSLVPMVRDAFLTDELIRIDCKGLEKSDYKKIGCKLRDLVPCILVTFDKEQIVVWRGNDYKPLEDGYFLTDRESFDNPDGNSLNCTDGNDCTVDVQCKNNFESSDDESGI